MVMLNRSTHSFLMIRDFVIIIYKWSYGAYKYMLNFNKVIPGF